MVEMPIFRDKGPVMSFLSERKTVVLDEPLIVKLGIDPPQELPPGITKEAAVELIAGTPWAMGAGEGVARKLGLTPDTPEFRAAAYNWAKALAEGMLKEYKPARRRRR